MVQFNSSLSQNSSMQPAERTSVQNCFMWCNFWPRKSYANKVRSSGTRGTEDRVMAIRPRPSFDPKSFLAKVGEGRTIGKYRKDQIVFSQGNPADAVFYIQRGKAKVTVVSEHGREAVVAVLGSNEFIGEACLAGQTQRIATATTMMDSVIVRLEKEAIVRVIHEEPTFSEMFIAHLLGRAQSPVRVLARGGELRISFKEAHGEFSDVWLEGPARVVYTGEISK